MINLSCVVKTNFKTEYFITQGNENTRVLMFAKVFCFSQKKSKTANLAYWLKLCRKSGWATTTTENFRSGDFLINKPESQNWHQEKSIFTRCVCYWKDEKDKLYLICHLPFFLGVFFSRFAQKKRKTWNFESILHYKKMKFCSIIWKVVFGEKVRLIRAYWI